MKPTLRYVPGGEGDDCSAENFACDYTAKIYCSPEDRRCHGPAREGEDCSVRYCEAYTYCAEDTFCKPLTAEGEACTDTLECGAGFLCEDVCLPDGRYEGYDQPILSESCTLD